jgi:hypothetical protein
MECFVDGIGRFAGMTGTTTATGEAPSSAPTIVVWSGDYQLSGEQQARKTAPRCG